MTGPLPGRTPGPPPGPPVGAGGLVPPDSRRYPGRLYQPVYRPPGPGPLPPRRRASRRSPIVAPLLAFAGLMLVGGASVWAVSLLGVGIADGGAALISPAPSEVIPSEESPDPDASSVAAPEIVEPEPSDLPDIVEPPPDQRATVKGTILFSRGGDIWAASGQDLRRLTNSDSTKSDSGPTWSPDGKFIYFIRTTKRPTANSRPGGLYTLYTTDVWRMKADGSDRKRVYDSLIKDARGIWFSHVLQPSVARDGTTVAVVSDGPDGSGPVVLHLLNAKAGRLSKVAAPSQGDLGHNDPDFSPDGGKIAFTYNSAKGDDGVPRVGILSCKTRSNCTLGKTKLLRAGYAHPSWSPDGTWLAVEATRGSGRDIVIVEPRKGDVRVVLTNDGDSFAPVVSPDGDQIAYLHRDGVDIDVRVMTLDITADGRITLLEDRAVTDDGSIDGESPPEWFIPADQLKRREPVEPAGEESTEPNESTEPSEASAPPLEEANDDEGVPPPPA